MSSIDKRNNKIRVFGPNKGAKHFQRADAFVVESPVLKQTCAELFRAPLIYKCSLKQHLKVEAGFNQFLQDYDLRLQLNELQSPMIEGNKGSLRDARLGPT